MKKEIAAQIASEDTSLLPQTRRPSKRRSSVLEISQEFCRKNEVGRRQSVEIMGVACPFENADEKAIREKLWHDKEEWAELQKLGEEDD
eukprot:CAMPEP_0178776250 /NCGR_PEP_ID=MMETSP0744-20121128/24622_1 /TAXON_ID=913974 /ORGANISM="Nitzschia punctata, Strain CCMP561" /LENGTH=88 /DNA_ID=CAMNT_0020433275 /DNA_START=180 /DNA_END=446 /DNA_ORIENTATION=-